MLSPPSPSNNTIQTGITWKQCTELPIKLSKGKTTVINAKVYCGGGEVNDEYTVYCYDPSQDKWTTLPPLPVSYFGLGQVNGKLVAVGGQKKLLYKYKESNEVYTYDEKLAEWKQTIPPMPTARSSPGVLSLQSALVVEGGNTVSYTAAVEIFKLDTSQWYRTDSLPTVCYNISLVAIGTTCYILGAGLPRNEALYASVDDLFGNAVPANQTTHSHTSDTQSVWKTLPNTPTYGPAAAVLAGNLLAIGGDDENFMGATKEVYMYSPSTNSWIHISDLPAPLSDTTVAVLSLTKILVIGGLDNDYAMVNTVYRGLYCNI